MTRGEPEWSWRRWLMLGIYGLTAILNFAMWLTYACVSEAEIAFTTRHSTSSTCSAWFVASATWSAHLQRAWFSAAKAD